jgi:hypothetical protein
MDYYVYVLIRSDNGKPFYVGCAIQLGRISTHLSGRDTATGTIVRSLRDLGYETIPIIVRDDIEYKEARLIETCLIDALNGLIVNKRRYVGGFCEETRRRMSLAKLGKPSARKGKRYGPTERGKIAQGQLGWITNGVEDKRVNKNNPIPDGWYRGRSLIVTQQELDKRIEQKQENRKIWLYRNRNRSWITNGLKSKRLLDTDPIPDGWYLGRKVNR